jgi:cytochrome c peroxidase
MVFVATVAVFGVGLAAVSYAAASIPNLQPYANPSGFARTMSSRGSIDTSNPFFQSLGTNGRACVDCHEPSAGFSITPLQIQKQFLLTGGRHPLFRPVDGANSPRANVSTLGARALAYSMLLRKGLLRVGLPVPASAEFELVGVNDPYRYASAKDLSLFRRPLPSTNLRFTSAIMWDGRETQLDPNISNPALALNLRASLLTQANNATRGHAQGLLDLTPRQAEQIVDLETSFHTAQATVTGAGALDTGGATGGPQALAKQKFFLGINDPVGNNPTGAPPVADVMTMYGAWKNSPIAQRRSISRGEQLFNTKQFRITGVSGLNDDFNVPLIVSSCSGCHNAPNAGTHSVPELLDLGLTDASQRTPDMPLYTLRNKTTGVLRQTTDPGQALVTGKWKHIGRFKSSVLRGLAPRAPYFHNGSAATLMDVVEFYNRRFTIGLTRQEKIDLDAFLKAL